MKTLKNVKDINKIQLKKQLKPIENDINNKNMRAFKKLRFFNKLSLEEKETIDEIKELDKKTDYTKLVCMHTNGKIFDFNILED